ncbi:Lipid droplet-associated hydrolase [Euphorbia peplus]|nr:Lipid droplet-associated hydrolase [Euphorbia peplus]
MLRYLHCARARLNLRRLLIGNSGRDYRTSSRKTSMSSQNLLSEFRKPVKFRMCNVSSHPTELLEIHADNPKFHVLFIPGNPGFISFYTEFLESLYEFLGGVVSITAIAHISHSRKDWENGRLFSLQEQIDHKVDFINHELQNIEVPVVLVGHSIGAYIAIEVLKRFRDKVIYCVALYPFLTLNPKATWQTIIDKISGSSILSAGVSFCVGLLGMLPNWALRSIVLKSLGKSWSASAVEVACSQLPKYYVSQNVLHMAMHEFRELSAPLDWTFLKENKDKITFLFGSDDHWGPLHLLEEISKQVPDIPLSIEREGHTHNFSCSDAGSVWVARHVASLLKSVIPTSGK